MSTFKNIMSWVWPVVIGLILAKLLTTFVISVVKVDGLSMYPNLQNNERVVMLKMPAIRRDAVVVFNAEGVDTDNPNVTSKTKYVKRVIGLPGDKIEYKNNGDLYINGKYRSQSYITKEQRTTGTLDLVKQAAKGVTLGTGKTFTVPKDSYFVLGDNRENSNDSRYYGFVPKDKILGTVKAPFWDSGHELINSFGN
ncbi:signal peptidase I [Ligilactobacillus faecis]|uniref:Signal peptidase I n=1 Tax=Ligilactobacillus faecis TaxID=762833 RepID=A0ABV4DQJ6_9LACO|nr:signal peptidase I [Ligilactobacillus faecis]WGN89153.1 signal peptidase I [Ligilactobacillus faecis]